MTNPSNKLPLADRIRRCRETHPEWGVERIASAIRGANRTIINAVLEGKPIPEIEILTPSKPLPAGTIDLTAVRKRYDIASAIRAELAKIVPGQLVLEREMCQGNEDNKPHLCVPTLDGNAHVIPTEVFDKIISGEMKITDMDDWEIITRTAFSEWLRGLETAAKTRVYKAAVDHIADTMAAGAWQDGPAPKDGSWILGLFYGLPYVVCYDSWEISEEGGPKETEEGWCLAGQDMHPMDQGEPEKWARIIHPNRHMPASWDGPGDQR